MSITLQCPDCGKQYRLRDNTAGKQFACKACLSVISIPAEDTDGLSDDEDFGVDKYGADEIDDYERRRPHSHSRSRNDDRGSRTRAPRKKKRRRRQRKSSVHPGVLVGGVIGGIVLVTALVGAIALIGKSDSSFGQQKKFIDEIFTVHEGVVDAMENVHDRQSAREAAEKIDDATDRLIELAERRKELPRVTKSQDAELIRYTETRSKKLLSRAAASKGRLRTIVQNEPALRSALLRYGRVSGELSKGSSIRF